MNDPTTPLPLDEDSYYRDQTEFFGRLRESCPVARVQMVDGRTAWAVTRYEDVRQALADQRLAKDIHRFPGGGKAWPSQEVNLHAHMLHRDPPDHTRLRGLMQQAFTPRRVASLRPRVQEVAAGLLDRMAAESGDVSDLLEAFARPLPVIVLFELLGVPEADRERLSTAVIDYSQPEKWTQVTRELAAYLTELIAAKRVEPGDDLISELIRARDADANSADDAPALSETELLSGVFQLIMAGFDTTVNLIANGTVALLTHPAEAARLRADPSLFPGPSRSCCGSPTRSTTRPTGSPPRRCPSVTCSSRRGSGSCWRRVRRTGTRPGSPTRTGSTSPGTPAATSRSGTASTSAWARRWPGWRPRSRSAPCSTASPGSASPSPRKNCSGVARV